MYTIFTRFCSKEVSAGKKGAFAHRKTVLTHFNGSYHFYEKNWVLPKCVLCSFINSPYHYPSHVIKKKVHLLPSLQLDLRPIYTPNRTGHPDFHPH